MSDDPEVVSIEFQSGDINAEEGSGKLHVFHSPIGGSVRAGGKETFLAAAIQECPVLGKRGAVTRFPSRKNIQEEIGGKVFHSSYTIAEGEVLKIFGQGRAGGWNAVLRTAVVYIRLRRTGPFHRLKCTVPSAVPDAALREWNVTGRFDILEMECAEALGVKVLPGCRGQGTKAAVTSLFQVEVLAPETCEAVRIGVKTVEGRSMPVVLRRRRLELTGG